MRGEEDTRKRKLRRKRERKRERHADLPRRDRGKKETKTTRTKTRPKTSRKENSLTHLRERDTDLIVKTRNTKRVIVAHPDPDLDPDHLLVRPLKAQPFLPVSMTRKTSPEVHIPLESPATWSLLERSSGAREPSDTLEPNPNIQNRAQGPTEETLSPPTTDLIDLIDLDKSPSTTITAIITVTVVDLLAEMKGALERRNKKKEKTTKGDPRVEARVLKRHRLDHRVPALLLTLTTPLMNLE